MVEGCLRGAGVSGGGRARGGEGTGGVAGGQALDPVQGIALDLGHAVRWGSER